jgi:hypothetical protein
MSLSPSIRVALVAAALAASPSALAQKMYRCPDGKGGTVFQQGACPETEQEAEARKKERDRLQAEQVKKKEDEERRKAEQIEKARERDKAYLQQQEERRKLEEAEKKAMDANRPATSSDEDGLPDNVAVTYPGPWKEGNNTIITNAFAKKPIEGCSPYRYRQRAGGGAGDFLVQCKTGGAKKNHYFVWPQSEAVYGPVKY